MEITRHRYFASILNDELLHMRITLAYEAPCYVADLLTIFILDVLFNYKLYLSLSLQNRLIGENVPPITKM